MRASRSLLNSLKSHILPFARVAITSLTLALACSSEKAITPQPDELTIVSGDAQSALINNRLSNSLTVRVTNAAGAPHAGVLLEWAVTAGQGSLATTSQTSDAQGMASASWTLGPIVGPQAVSVHISGSTVQGISFRATAVAPSPIVLRYDGSTWQTELADTGSVASSLDGVWAISPSQVFAVGSCALLELLAGQWQRVPLS